MDGVTDEDKRKFNDMLKKPPIPHKEISDKLINMKFEGSKFILDPSCNIVCYLIELNKYVLSNVYNFNKIWR